MSLALCLMRFRCTGGLALIVTLLGRFSTQNGSVSSASIVYFLSP